MKYLDLFSGLGGFALGAYNAGWRFDEHYFSEVDEYAIEVYRRRFPGAIPLGDIREIDTLPTGEWFITGGFPCVDISVAGKGAGIHASRSGLWFEMWRIVRELRPRWVIVENVGAITFRGLADVVNSLAEIGYDCEWQDIRASDMGAPHRRERIWIVAYPHQSGESISPINGEPRCRELGQDVADTEEAIGWGTGRTEDAGRGYPEAGRCGIGRCGIQHWPAEPAVGRVVDGIPSALDITGIIEYICFHGTERQVEMAKAVTTKGKDGKVRILRLYLEVAEAPRYLGEAGPSTYSLSEMSYKDRLCQREMGAGEAERTGLCDMPQDIHAERLTLPQDLQPRLPIPVREVQRWLAVGDRVNRLKCLGDSIVPQIAELLFRQIKATM